MNVDCTQHYALTEGKQDPGGNENTGPDSSITFSATQIYCLKIGGTCLTKFCPKNTGINISVFPGRFVLSPGVARQLVAQ